MKTYIEPFNTFMITLVLFGHLNIGDVFTPEGDDKKWIVTDTEDMQYVDAYCPECRNLDLTNAVQQKASEDGQRYYKHFCSHTKVTVHNWQLPSRADVFMKLFWILWQQCLNVIEWTCFRNNVNVTTQEDGTYHIVFNFGTDTPSCVFFATDEGIRELCVGSYLDFQQGEVVYGTPTLPVSTTIHEVNHVLSDVSTAIGRMMKDLICECSDHAFALNPFTTGFKEVAQESVSDLAVSYYYWDRVYDKVLSQYKKPVRE